MKYVKWAYAVTGNTNASWRSKDHCFLNHSSRHTATSGVGGSGGGSDDDDDDEVDDDEEEEEEDCDDDAVDSDDGGGARRVAA